MKSSHIIIYKNLDELYQSLNRAQDYLKLYEEINESPLKFVTNQVINQIVKDAEETNQLLLNFQLSQILQKKQDNCNYILLQQSDNKQIHIKIERNLIDYAHTNQQKILFFNISEQKYSNFIDQQLMYLTFESQDNQTKNIHQNVTIIPVKTQNESITYVQMQYIYKYIIANREMQFNPNFIYIHISIAQQLISLEGILFIIRQLAKSKLYKIIIYLDVGQESDENQIRKYLITICNGLWGNKISMERELPSEQWLSEMIVLLKKSNLFGESKIFQQIRANLNCLNQFHRREQEIKTKMFQTIQLFEDDKQLSIKPIDEENQYIEFNQFHIDYKEQIIVLQCKTDFREFYYVWQFENLQERQFKKITIPQRLENPSLLVKDGDILICYGFIKNQFNDQIYLFQIKYQQLLTLNRNQLLNVIKCSNCNYQIIKNRNKPGVCKNSILGESNQFMLVGGEFELQNQNQNISVGKMNIIEFIQYDIQSLMFHSEILDKTSNCFKVAFLPSPSIIVLEGVLHNQNYVFVIDDLFRSFANQPINRKHFVYMITAEWKKKIKVIIIDKTPMIIEEYPKIKTISLQYTQYLNQTQDNQLVWNVVGNAIIEDAEKYSQNRQQKMFLIKCMYNKLSDTFVINFQNN